MNESEAIQDTLTNEEAACSETMRRLFATLPDGTAKLEVNREPSGLIFRLTPANKRSANFGLHYDGCVDVFFGSFGTTFEIDFRSKSEDGDLAAALAFAERIGLAVIAGKCEERAGFTGICGTVEIDGKPYRITHFFHFRLFPRTIRYAPYPSRSGDC